MTVEGRDAGGQARSIDELFASDYARMVRVAYLLTGSRATAEDLVQDSFVRLHARQLGYAVLIDGQWKVSRETTCASVARAGVRCPAE